MSRINCPGLPPGGPGINALMALLSMPAGTIAIFEVIAPSMAFKLETVGMLIPCGHSVRKLTSPTCGITVALNTYASGLLAGIPQELPTTATGMVPSNSPMPLRVSMTRQGLRLYSDNGLGAELAGAK